MVKPAKPTRTGFLPLSDLDLVGHIYDVPLAFFYSPPPESLAGDAVFQVMKDSLSKTLVYFYPLAGRLSSIGHGRYQVDCNAAGVLMVMAEADVSCPAVNETDADLSGLAPWVDIRTTPLEEYPIIKTQVTRFRCGGIVVVFVLTHAVIDGASAAYFLRQWGRITRGEPVEEVPLLDRKLLVNLGNGVACPPVKPLEFQEESAAADCSFGTPVKYSRPTFHLTEFQVELLRTKANRGKHSKISRYEAITAHIWRSACKAWHHNGYPNQDTTVGLTVELRKRLSLPESYVGNAVLDVVACCASADLISNSLSYSAMKIHETINKVTLDYLKGVCAFLKATDDLTCFQHKAGEEIQHPAVEGETRMPMLLVTSLLTLKLEENDFGWGNNLWAMPVEYGIEGECVIKNGTGRSVVVIVCLQETHVEAFKKFFLEDLRYGKMSMM